MKIPMRIPGPIAFLFWMSLVTGVLYPLLITGIAQLAFPARANGSLVSLGGEVRGSTLLAQKFESPRFFRARPSATDYAYLGAGGSNLAPTSAALAKAVAEAAAAWRSSFGPGPVPAEMTHASGSGLDPDISPEAALAQVDSVAAARGLDAGQKAALAAAVRKAAADASGALGPPRVNVVQLNLLLETEAVLGGKWGKTR